VSSRRAPREQYLLTKRAAARDVDRIIVRRLRLPSFPRWRRSIGRLRGAQRAPPRIGLESDGPLVSAVRRLEPGDLVVVVGAAALPAALFIAAHDAEVFLIDHDLGAVEGAESRALTEPARRPRSRRSSQLVPGTWRRLVITILRLAPARAREPARAARRAAGSHPPRRPARDPAQPDRRAR